MKKFTLSLAAVMAMSTFAIAGGDIAPVEEPMIEVVEPVVNDSGFYLGIAYGMANASSDYYKYDGYFDVWSEWTGTYEEDHNTVMLQAGYKINSYFAVEGRYWNSFGDADWSNKGEKDSYHGNGIANSTPPAVGDGPYDLSGSYDGDFKAWGIYVKPMYPVTDAFDIYALLGYGNVEIGDGWLDESGFQWGLGASYEFTNNLAVFVDYVNMYNDDGSEENLGYVFLRYRRVG